MKSSKLNDETIAPPADPLSALVDSQNEARPAAAPNLDQLIADELRPPAAEQFDPAFHETDPTTGGPVWTADHKLKRKRGRKPGQVYAGNAAAGGELPEGELAGPPAPPMTRAAAMAEAKLLAGMGFGTFISVKGPAWEPEPEENDAITEALAEYIFVTGGIGLPAWAGVALAFGSYALRRMKVGQMIGLAAPEPAAPPVGEPDNSNSQFSIGRGTSNSAKPPVHNAA